MAHSGALGEGLALPHLPAGARDCRAVSGLAVLVRHAQTEPGIGDPPGYRLGDCGSQRQLSAAGRTQASRLGPALAARKLTPTQVLSSHWCRCLDTASLAFGRVTPWAALNSFFDSPEREPAQTAQLRLALAALAPCEVAVWVTHQVNIGALVGVATGFGDAVVVAAEPLADGRVAVRVIDRFSTLAPQP